MLCPDPESFSNKGLEYAAQLVNLTARKITQKHFEEIAPDYDCLLVRFNTIVGGEVFNSSSMVKSVISPTTGLDHIDMVTAKKNKVKVYHLRGQKRFLNGVSGTAELTIGLMLSVLRKIPQSFAAVKQSVWEPGPYRGNEVSGKTLGIIGCGRLGSKVARVGVALGMDVIAYDPYKIRFPAGVKAKNSLKQLLNISDIVTLHVPLTEQTRHMIAVEEIYEMKDEVVIINTSRGAIIETQSILDGLLSLNSSDKCITQ